MIQVSVPQVTVISEGVARMAYELDDMLRKPGTDAGKGHMGAVWWVAGRLFEPIEYVLPFEHRAQSNLESAISGAVRNDIRKKWGV